MFPDTLFTKVLFSLDDISAKSKYNTSYSTVSSILYNSVNSSTVLVIVQVIVLLSLSYTPPFKLELSKSIS